MLSNVDLYFRTSNFSDSQSSCDLFCAQDDIVPRACIHNMLMLFKEAGETLDCHIDEHFVSMAIIKNKSYSITD
jgi:hypothetical protein